MPRCSSTDISHEKVNRWARKKASKPGGRERAQEGVRGHQETSVKWRRLRIFLADPYEWDLTKARPRNTAEVGSDKCQEIVSEIPAEPRGSCVGKRLRAYSLHSHLHSGATQPRHARLTSLSRGHCACFEDSFETYGVVWVGMGVGAGHLKQKAYPRLQSRVLTHHNQEAVVILQGCWSSVFCRESDIPVLEHKTDRVCTTQFSGDSVSLLPEGHSHFHPASILDACWIFLEANPNN